MDSQSIPTVSVIMPMYNVAPYVERCLLSVMWQTYPATECIIVDDASTDDSVVRCEHLISGYSGSTCFSILQHDRNCGLSAARNTGTDKATSTYIYYVDSDDEMTPDCLEMLVSPVQRDERIEMVQGNYSMVYSAMKQIRFRLADCNTHFMEDTPLELHTNEELRKWFYHGKVRRTDTVWNKLLKLSFVKKNKLYNKEGLRYNEDGLWSFFLMRCVNHAAFVHEVTYIHYFRPGSIVMGVKKYEFLHHCGIVFREIARNTSPNKQIEEIEHWFKRFCYNYIEASDNRDYQFAYDVFRENLSDGHHKIEILHLKIVNYLAKSSIGRVLYTKLVRAGHLIKRGTSVIFGRGGKYLCLAKYHR